MNTFNVSRLTRSVGCTAAMTAVLLLSSATQAGFPDVARLQSKGLPVPVSAYRPAGHGAVNHSKPTTAPTQASARHFGTDGMSQGRWSGLHGEGCLGKPRLPNSVIDPVHSKVLVNPVPLLRPKMPKRFDWPKFDTNIIRRPLPNRIPMR
jgi:hypothetical protein